ncbi:MAG: imidazole glycerol phosphate synthase subunit HisH [Flavobacteriaceae bacterium]|nr:imidazole glycerol phosphate synthase subunit HisH [Flavobacteriaceae bacterium]
MSIVVVDYGIGNVKSIINAFDNQGETLVLSRDESVIMKANGLILPGVGAFSHGMNNLEKYGLVKVIIEYVKTGKPLLGICLGMQMLLEESEEFGDTKGLGLIKGKVIRLPVEQTNKIKLPHISWNGIKEKNIDWKETIFDNVKCESDMYFVHTYVAKPENEDEILSVTDYFGVEFCSSIKKDNIYGCQFHPEKSAVLGLSIIKNFINICK